MQAKTDNRTLMGKWSDAYERQLFLDRCNACIDYIEDDKEDEKDLNSLGCMFMCGGLFAFGVACIVGIWLLFKYVAI